MNHALLQLIRVHLPQDKYLLPMMPKDVTMKCFRYNIH